MNSIICMFQTEFGEKGGFDRASAGGRVKYTKMPICNLAMYWKRGKNQIQGSGHEGIV